MLVVYSGTIEMLVEGSVIPVAIGLTSVVDVWGIVDVRTVVYPDSAGQLVTPGAQLVIV
jgi:hypothetical protein